MVLKCFFFFLQVPCAHQFTNATTTFFFINIWYSEVKIHLTQPKHKPSFPCYETLRHNRFGLDLRLNHPKDLEVKVGPQAGETTSLSHGQLVPSHS